jgi:hypothetical protein
MKAAREIVLAGALIAAAAVPAAEPESDLARLTGRILGATPAMNDLRELTDRIGGRISGTPACDRAVDWAAAKFRSAGIASVSVPAFTLPAAWVPRGIEASSLSPAAFPLRAAAAPGTAGTPGGRPSRRRSSTWERAMPRSSPAPGMH